MVNRQRSVTAASPALGGDCDGSCQHPAPIDRPAFCELLWDLIDNARAATSVDDMITELDEAVSCLRREGVNRDG